MKARKPKRLAVIPANLGKLPLAAFEYLVLKLNTLQNDIEFEFLPINKDYPFLTQLRPKEVINMDDFRQKAPDFIKWLDNTVLSTCTSYDLSPQIPDRYVLVTLSSFDSHWYEIWEERYSAVFLGEWKKAMSPPSLLDFMLTMIIVEGIVCLMGCSTHLVSHLSTRSCPADFNSTLRDVRYKTLQGFLCADCRSTLQKAIGAKSTENWIKILDKGWIGSSTDPNSTANISAKLGYDLFLTKGLSLGFWQKMLQTLREDGVKELIKVVGVLVLTALLILLGLKN